MAILRALLLILLSLGLTVALQVALHRRLPEPRRARAWNGASWGAAVYAFGPLSMIPFFWVSRAPGRLGVALALAAGVGSAVLLLVALQVADLGLDAVLGPSSWR